MKILYVANDRRAAQLVVNALRVHAPDATLASTESLLDAERWVSANRDFTALVVDVEVQHQSSASFVRHVRGLGLVAPIVVVASEATGTPSAVLKAGADDFVTAGGSLATELPVVVDRTVKRRTAVQPSEKPLRILYAGDAALARQSLAHPAWSIEIAEAALTPDEPFQPIPADFPDAGDPLPFDILFVEHDHPAVDAFSVLKHIADRGLQVPVIVVVEWDDALGLPALKLGAVDCVVKSAEAFRALTYRLDRVFAAQTQDERSQRELAAARQSWEETRTKLETSMAAEAAAVADERRRREADGAEATAARAALERRVADVEAALRGATERASAERVDLEDRLAQEVAARKTAEHNLAHADALFRETEQRRASEASASADLLGRRAAELTANLAHATRSRDTLTLQLSDAEAALEESRKERGRQVTELAEAAATRQTLERRLAEAEASLQQAAQRALTARDAGVQAERSHAELQERLAREVSARQAAEARLADAEAGRAHDEQRLASEQRAAAAKLAERQAEHDASLAQAAAAREVLERRLSDVEAELERARQDRAAEAAAAAEQLTLREAALERRLALEGSARQAVEARLADAKAQREASLAQAAAVQEALERRSSDAAAALEQSRKDRAAESAAAAEQLTQRDTELRQRLAQEIAARQELEALLADAHTAREEERQRLTSELTTAAAYFSERQAEHDARLAQAAASQAATEKELVAALDAARRDHAAAAAAAAEQLAQREAELATAAAHREALERQLADAEAAARASEERAAAERQVAAREADQRRAELEGRLARESAARESLERELAAAQAARDAAAQQAALRQAELEAQLAQGLTERQAIELDLAKAQATHHEAERRHAAELGKSAAQIAELEAARKSLQDRLAETDAEIQATQERTAAERAEADQLAAARQAELEARLAQEGAERRTLQARLEESAASADLLAQRGAELTASLAHAGRLRETLEQQVSDAAAALEEAQRTRTSDAEAYLRQAAIRKAEFEERQQQEATARAALERDLAAARQTADQDKRRFEEDIARTRAEGRDRETRLEERLARERDDHARALAEVQEVVRNLQAGRDALQQSLGEAEKQRERLERARLAGQAELERAGHEHAAGRARLEALVTERESQLREQSSGHAASLGAARKTIAQIEGSVAALNQELEAAKTERAALRAQADVVPALKTQLEESQAESRRRFEQNPHGMCRCNRDGALTQANRALASLLGYRTGDELRKVNVATAVFESADDLRWLIDRCLSTRTAESVETTWKRKDGGRLIVKLLAVAAAPDAIEIVAEDLTTRRALEERLRQAQRMEAVGRLASEVAVTCDNLLRDVSQDGEQWLATIDGNTAVRHRAEQLLAEVTRAGNFLRQLAAYGRKQTRALEPVNVTTVMRDMEPVLKRLAGDDIELLLPKTTRPVTVDVEAERVERVLVNVASYARERMPSGGRLKIELASVVVDGRFVAKHPNVRPGAHVLITVTEVREAARLAPPGTSRTEPAATAVSTASDKPGVDLGALLKLIADCGGHLWMTAEPPGNMILKIHLPKRASDDPRPVVTRSERGGSMSRWFGH